MRLLASATALWLFGVPSVLAQTGSWLILPTADGDEISWMQPTVGKVSRELRKQGVGVWSPHRASARLQETGPAPPTVLTDDDIEAWAERSKQALLGLASGGYEAALVQLEEAQAFSRDAVEALNRDPTRAQAVVDTCLYLVRALVETADEQGAAIQAEECVRIVPSGAPTPYMHPPSVLRFYDAAAKRGPTHTGALLIESEPSGCAVRVNGVLVGETPTEMADLYPGEYRVQLECDSAAGLVHMVDVPPGNTSLFVFDDFDRALRFEPVLHLQYGGPPGPRRQARDARELARVLPASAVVLVSLAEAGVLDLRLATGTQIGAALARVKTGATGPNTAAIISATATLLARECKDFTGTEPIAVDCNSGQPLAPTVTAPTAADLRPPHAQFVSGLVLASVGTASLLTGYGLLIARRFAGDDWVSDPASLDAHDKWQSLGTGSIAMGTAGAGLLVTAMPLVLPYEAKTPWWAWVSGGVGLAAAASSIALAITADPKPPDSCSSVGLDPEPCVNGGRQIDRAILLGVTAAPLLTMPLVFLLRKVEKKVKATSVAPSILASRQGASIGLRGEF